ncbi:MAG TPA: insulinase family protein [Candidatus Paceibacterota bacterium]|nr:insulinase family protein [Candidatus Paceibacterota bacterium]
MNLASFITEREIAPAARVFVAPTKVKDLVRIDGSVLGGGNHFPFREYATVSLAAELFDAGTTKRSKAAIREELAARGISLHFSPGGDRTYFSGSCFPEDLPRLLSILFECLHEAGFPVAEIQAAKERIQGALIEEKSDTRVQAAGALARALYAQADANYVPTSKEKSASIERIERRGLTGLSRTFGVTGLVLAIVGDTDARKALRAVDTALAKLPVEGYAPVAKETAAATAVQSETLVRIPDKANIDTYLGTRVPLTVDSPEYLAFVAFTSMLGGRGLSTGHLMRTIRERDGYTYGIYAMPAGFDDQAAGYFRIWATFSPHNFKEAVAATRKEIGIFLKSGMTEEALAKKKGEIAGSYQVGLSTTSGLAGILHKIGREGKPLSYIDAYPELVRALTLADIKAASALVPLSKLSLAAAGSLAK